MKISLDRHQSPGMSGRPSLADTRKVVSLTNSAAGLEALAVAIHGLGRELQHAQEQRDKLLARKFNRSSEKLGDAQLRLFEAKVSEKEVSEPVDPVHRAAATVGAVITTDLTVAIKVVEEMERAKRKAARAARKRRLKENPGSSTTDRLPAGYETREHRVEVPEANKVCTCGHPRCVIRDDRTTHIERKVVYTLVTTVRTVYGCSNGGCGVYTPPPPDEPVDKGQFGFSVVAGVLLMRYLWNVPVKRISAMYATDGLLISDDAIRDAAAVTFERLAPVLEALRQVALTGHLVNLDDTPVTILDATLPARSRKGRIWVAVGDGVNAYYFYTTNWKQDSALPALNGLTANVQGDGYAGFPNLAAAFKVLLAGCWAHVRRKLLAAQKQKDDRADRPLVYIGHLYAVEKLARLRNVNHEELSEMREKYSKVLITAIEAWATTIAPEIEPGSPLGEAWTYLRNQWPYLTIFLTRPHIGLDNNAAERALRMITIGRKQWLFFQNDETPTWAAGFASIFETAKLHGVDVPRYFEWLLREIARREWSVPAARELLPDRWAAREKERAEQGGCGELVGG